MKKNVFLILLLIIVFIGCEKKEDKVKPIEEISKLEPFNKIFFVGNENGKDAVFLYELDKNQFNKFWSNEKESVYELSYNSDYSEIFFVTVKNSGKKGLLPFVEDVSLYNINIKTDRVEKVASFGNGIQINIYWDDLTTCRVVMNRTTSSPENFVEQIIYLFSTNGKKIFEEKNLFDLRQTGYPQLPVRRTNTISYSGDYSIIEGRQENEFAFVLDSKKNNGKFLISTSPFSLSNSGWTLDENFLVFTTVDISPSNETLYDNNPFTSILFIYSIKNQTLIKNVKGSGIKNFIINANLLFYDDGFGSNSNISILDLNKNEVINKIEVQGGCGIKSIPKIPNYDA